MPTRIVSMIVIAAVLACPLWCSQGSVVGAPCCSIVYATPVSNSEPAVPDCCDRCRQKTSSKSESEQDSPEELSDESSCQGVCGGAVLEKPSELDDDGVGMNPPLFEAGKSATSQFAHWHRVLNAEDVDPGGGNYGRSLRALHSSFLC